LQREQERTKILAAREYERHKQEMEKLDFQSRLREREATEGRERPNDGNGNEGSIGRSVGKAPKMPYFDEKRDFMDSYLGRFERFAKI